MEIIIESELCKFYFRKPLSLSFVCLVLSRFPSLSLSFNNRPLDDFASLHKLPTLCELPLILINVVRVDVVASSWPLEFLRVYRCTEQDYGLSTLLLPRESSPFAQFISFQQELPNLARGRPDYKRL